MGILVKFLMLGAAWVSLPTLVSASTPTPSKCPGGTKSGIQYGTLQSNIGRKIAIVIDSSGSNSITDPTDLRIDAAKAFNEMLVSKNDAGPNDKADLVTVVDFDSSATLLYSLGDPDGAGSEIEKIDALGGTSIYSGVKLAIDELTKKGSGDTAKRSGIIVLTDGQDSSVTLLIKEIDRAKSLGIRVNFGFLESPPPSIPQAPPTDLLKAILATGGIHSSINSAQAQQYFVNLVAARGPTDLDGNSGGSKKTAPLLPGLTTSGLISEAAPATFSYYAQSGEKLNFTIASLSNQDLKATVSENSNELKSAETDSTGEAFISLNLKKDTKLKLVVEALSNGTSKGVFSVAFNSSIPYDHCTLNSTNTTIAPIPSSPPTYVSMSGKSISTSQGVITGAFFGVLGFMFLVL